ncbi:MAG: 23S rRNA pseudouridine(2605) synthase RluB [Pseudomonadota bacterium]
MAERVQKLLANVGLGSRREIERWIQAGRVTVNGEPAELGQRVSNNDQIFVDGRRVNLTGARHRKAQYIRYNKPPGQICTRRDEQRRPTVFESLPRVRGGRWVAVGRLDLNTSGLMLFTTDGQLANRLMHPSSQIERRYMVRVHGLPSDEVLQKLTTGVELDDGPGRFATLSERNRGSANQWFEVTLREGRNREVRRLWEAVGCSVSRLTRIAYGPIQLDKKLRQGQYAYLTDQEASALRELVA